MIKIFFIKTFSLSLFEHLGIPLAMYHSKYFPWTFIKTRPTYFKWGVCNVLMPPRLIEQATDKILSILYDMTSEKFPLSGRGLNLYLFLICEDLPLLRGNPGTPPRTLSYPGPPTRCLWGCVYWPSPAASPRQFYKRKKHNLLKLCHTKP